MQKSLNFSTSTILRAALLGSSEPKTSERGFSGHRLIKGIDLYEKSPTFKDINEAYTNLYSQHLLTLDDETQQKLKENYLSLANQPFSELEIKNDVLSIAFCNLYTKLFQQVKIKQITV